MANSPKAKGTRFETSLLRRCLTRVWPRMERSGSKVAYGQLPDFDDPAQRCPWAWEAKAGVQQRVEAWWQQASASADKVGLIPGLLWSRARKPDAPWVIFDWPAFEPVATFIDANLDEFLAHLDRHAATDPSAQ